MSLTILLAAGPTGRRAYWSSSLLVVGRADRYRWFSDYATISRIVADHVDEGATRWR